MHDCPKCQVPLHGHEQFCPACGTKQYVKPEFRNLMANQSSFNFVPLIIGVVVLFGLGFFVMQYTWIGQVINYKPPPEDPLAKLTPADARKQMADKLDQNFASLGAKAKLEWSAGGQPADLNAPGDITLSIDAALKNADDHKAIINPIKELMAPGKISTITFNDSRSHKTWTYSISPVESTSDNPESQQQ